MIFSTRNDNAKDGSNVCTTVELLEEAPVKPWKVVVSVDYKTVMNSYHSVRSDAERKSAIVHHDHLQDHGGKKL